MDVSPLNLGMIGAYYSITYTTIELFAASLTAKTKLKGLLEIVASASEFERHARPPRRGRRALRRAEPLARQPLESRRWTDPHVKTAALLQAALLGRMQLAATWLLDLARDPARRQRAAAPGHRRQVIVEQRLVAPGAAAMELSQT